jgi:hypothetical protein
VPDLSTRVRFPRRRCCRRHGGGLSTHGMPVIGVASQTEVGSTAEYGVPKSPPTLGCAGIDCIFEFTEGPDGTPQASTDARALGEKPDLACPARPASAHRPFIGGRSKRHAHGIPAPHDACNGQALAGSLPHGRTRLAGPRPYRSRPKAAPHQGRDRQRRVTREGRSCPLAGAITWRKPLNRFEMASQTAQSAG